MKANDVRLLTTAEYFRDLARMISTAKKGDRVAVATMSFRPEQPLVHAITNELEAAARRGANVYVTMDAYEFLKAGQGKPGPLWPHTELPKNLREPFRGRVAAFERISAAGGHCVITNMPKRPFSPIHGGRSHIKTAVIGDAVYIGGCNLNDASRLDIMARWHDRKAADWAFDTVREIVEHKSTQEAFGGKDRSMTVDSKTKLLVDAGVPKQSTILQNAYQLIDEAEDHVFLTCQYFPGGTTARHLKAAFNRGVQVTICYSHPSVHGTEAPAHYLYALKERTRMPKNFFVNRLVRDRPLLHAKVLCTEKGAMLGSHNYVVQGVNFGTAEIALRCNMPDFSKKLRAAIQQQISA